LGERRDNPYISSPKVGEVGWGMNIYNDRSLKNIRQSLRNNMPAPESILWNKIKGKQLNGYKFRRQYGVGNYIIDFYCSKQRLGIEIDGDSHYLSDLCRISDETRDLFLMQKNISMLRFTNKEIMENINGVIERILSILPPLTPPNLGGGKEE
jgi:very-short-patch-repair endonuclease